jgi:hypothetical protein
MFSLLIPLLTFVLACVFIFGTFTLPSNYGLSLCSLIYYIVAYYITAPSKQYDINMKIRTSMGNGASTTDNTMSSASHHALLSFD